MNVRKSFVPLGILAINIYDTNKNLSIIKSGMNEFLGSEHFLWLKS